MQTTRKFEMSADLMSVSSTDSEFRDFYVASSPPPDSFLVSMDRVLPRQRPVYGPAYYADIS